MAAEPGFAPAACTCCGDCGCTLAVRDDAWLRFARYARWLAWVSLVWMLAEAVLGLAAGVAAGSVALSGWAAGSAIEGAASVIVVWRFTGSRIQSPDAERRAQRAVAVSFWLLAAWIAAGAIRGLAGHDRVGVSVLGIALTASSVVIMPVLGIAKRRLGAAAGLRCHRGRGHPEPDVRRPGRRRAGRPGRGGDLAHLVSHRPGHRPWHRGLVRLGGPPVLARGSLLLGPCPRREQS